MKARWLTLFACVPLAIGTMLLTSCGGVGGPNGSSNSGGSSSATQNFLALMTTEQKSSKTIGAEACAAASCHGGVTSAAHLASMTTRATPSGQYATWKLTLHAQKGVTCENCHGPGGAHAAAPTNTDGTPHAILTFPSITSPAVCGQCHGPEHDDWAASAHSQLIPDPVTSAVTNPSGAQSSRCFVCHGGQVRAQYTENGIDPTQMTTTQIVNVANDVLNTEPYTATCSTCHNPHAKTGNLTGSGQEAQIYHSEVLTDSSGIAPGTTAAQFTTVNHICGECHNGRGTTATDAYLTKNTSRPSVHHSNQLNSLLGVGGWEGPGGPPQRSGTHALAPGQCATCHMPSSRHTFTVSYDTGCAPCHTTADASSRAAALKSEVVNDLTSLGARMGSWAQTTFGNSTFWDYTANIATGLTPPNQSLIPIEVKRARHNYYYVVISGDYGVHNPAYTRYLLQEAATNLDSAGIPPASAAQIARLSMSAKIQKIQQDKARANATDTE